MEPIDIDKTPFVSKPLLETLKACYPPKYHELLKKVMKGDENEASLYVECGIQTVIQLMEEWHNRGSETPINVSP